MGSEPDVGRGASRHQHVLAASFAERWRALMYPSARGPISHSLAGAVRREGASRICRIRLPGSWRPQRSAGRQNAYTPCVDGGVGERRAARSDGLFRWVLSTLQSGNRTLSQAERFRDDRVRRCVGCGHSADLWHRPGRRDGAVSRARKRRTASLGGGGVHADLGSPSGMALGVSVVPASRHDTSSGIRLSCVSADPSRDFANASPLSMARMIAAPSAADSNTQRPVVTC